MRVYAHRWNSHACALNRNLISFIRAGITENVANARVQFRVSQKSFRNMLIFVVGINTGLRVSDILALDVQDVKNKCHFFR